MEIGLNMPLGQAGLGPATLADLARAADDLGLAALYLGEHVVLFSDLDETYPSRDEGGLFFSPQLPLPDPLVAHAYLAGVTSRIRLATGVMLLPQRNPVYTAKHVATLDWLSGGRFELGIGLGWSRDEFDACAAPWEARGQRAEEYLAVMRALWADGISSYDGELYRLAACHQYPKPVQRPHPPFVFGGVTDAALDRAARLGDGWYGFDLSLEVLGERLAWLRARCEEHGRDPSALLVAVGGWGIQPATRGELDAYAELGVQRFVFSLTSVRAEELVDELAALAGRMLG